MAIRNNGIETNDTYKKEPSTAIKQGDWLQINASGNVIPLAATKVVAGLSGETITAQSTNYTANSEIVVDQATLDTDRFIMEVGTGTATAAMVGLTYDVDSDASKLKVSASGTQFRITRFINAGLVEVKLA